MKILQIIAEIKQLGTKPFVVNEPLLRGTSDDTPENFEHELYYDTNPQLLRPEIKNVSFGSSEYQKINWLYTTTPEAFNQIKEYLELKNIPFEVLDRKHGRFAFLVPKEYFEIIHIDIPR